MDRVKLRQLCEEVICIESKSMKLCSRQKCMDLLNGAKKYISENDLRIDAKRLGDVEYGKIHLAEMLDFYNKLLIGPE